MKRDGIKIKGLIDLADKGTDGTVKWRLTRDCNFKCSYCLQKNCVSNLQGYTNAQEDYEACLSIADEVNRCIEEMQSTKLRLFLIGGEITIYTVEQLKALLEKLSSKKIIQLYIVTNFFRDVNYFVELEEYLKSRGIVFYLCCSLHVAGISFEDFTKKILELKERTTIDFKVQKVLTTQNNENIEKLKAFCKENEIEYLIDGDLSYKSFNFKGELKCESFLRKNPRYKVILEDGSVDYIQTRNSLMLGQEKKFEYDTRHNAFFTNGKYCTMGVDYLYIARTFISGATQDGKCRELTPIKDFHPLKEPHKCQFQYCNLCGRLSVSDNKDDLKISIK